MKKHKRAMDDDSEAEGHSSMRLGGGGRFKALKSKLAKRGARNPGALAAWIGSHKYGASRMHKMAAAGHKRGG